MTMDGRDAAPSPQAAADGEGSDLHAVPTGIAVLGRFGRFLTAMVVVTVTAIWIIFCVIAYESYRSEWSAASLNANNVAVLLDHDITRSVEVADLSLKAVVKGFADPKVAALPSDLRRAVLFDEAAMASGLGSILILDKTGTIIANSRSETTISVNLGDRDYFTYFRDGDNNDALYVSHPFESRVSQEWSIGLSRRLHDRDGAFAGVVVVSVRLSYIVSLFNDVQLPPDSSVTLFDSTGSVVVRRPYGVSDIGQPAASAIEFQKYGRLAGEFTQVSNFDDVERLFVFRQLGPLPLFQSVGLSTAQFLGAWLTRVAILAVAFLVLSGLIMLLGATLWKELRRRSQAERALRALATTDGLTGLTNRRRFNELLATEWRRCARAGDPICLLMIDCDLFKTFNDAYGHVEGDGVLQMVAGTIRAAVARPADIAARFGGEEFVVLLPSTDLQGAQIVAERIRAGIEALGIPHAGSTHGRVTISTGIACRRPTWTDESSTLVRAADAALYQAKAAGRNRVAFDSAA